MLKARVLREAPLWGAGVPNREDAVGEQPGEAAVKEEVCK